MSLDRPERAGDLFAEPEIVSDARRLRALAHPVRLALMRQLMLHGPLTATQASELIGETFTTCSFHFRQLAKYGVVEEAGGGKGRARPWRMTTTGLTVTASDDPEAQIAEDALVRMVREKQIERYRSWLQTRASYPRRWQEAGDDSAYLVYLTVEELEQLTSQLTQILVPLFQARMADPSKRPAGSLPVQLLLLSHPTAYPESGDAEASAEGEHTPG